MTLKLIGAGFGRTGTTSIKAALETLGFDQCYHMQEVIKNPKHVVMWSDLTDGKAVNWDHLFVGYQSTVDWPACNFYKELMAHYPNAKVLLTVRNPEAWYESCRNTIYAIYRKTTMKLLTRLIPPLRRFLAMNEHMIWQGNFGGRFEDRDYAIAVFNQHNEAVIRSVPPERLLVYDVKQGWEPLCRFLDVPIPNVPFPHLNDTRSFRWLFRLVDGLVVASAVMGVGLLGWWLYRTLFTFK
ncbi:MAG: sulfotransferase [Caldilineaceae bacterium]